MRFLGRLRRVSFALGAFCGALMLGACAPKPWLVEFSPEADFLFLRCGGLGEACCRAPASAQNIPAFGPLVSCQEKLGCDIITNRCVSPCGGNGQVCCDGPETRAPKWTADGKVYSPNYWNMREMCDAGACDRQSHRCFGCGTQDGAPCCPPDAAQATARCVGDFLECRFDPIGLATSGTCEACGSRGKRPCYWGCDSGLDLRNGLCDLCGVDGQPPCDSGCKHGLGRAQGLCRACGNVNQIPCDNGCRSGLGIANGRCAVCGGTNQPPCDTGCRPGTRLINGVCTPCGGLNQPPCTNGCNYPLKVSGGVCRNCGAEGQVACDVGCNSGLVMVGSVCVKPSGTVPQACSILGQPCVADFVTGTHCCTTGPPLLCVYGQCRACVPHGAVCMPGGTQICCNAKDGDVCKLDVGSGQAVCDIPD